MTRKPAVTFAIVCVIAVVGLAAYLFHTGSRMRDAREAAPPGPPPNSAVPDPGSATAPAPTPSEAPAPAPTAAATDPVPPNDAPAPHVPATASARLFFRHNGVEAHYGSLAWVDTAKLDEVHYVDSLRCEVVHVSGGHGIDKLEAMVRRVVAEELRPLSEALLARPEATAASPSPAEGLPVSAVRERLRQRRAR